MTNRHRILTMVALLATAASHAEPSIKAAPGSAPIATVSSKPANAPDQPNALSSPIEISTGLPAEQALPGLGVMPGDRTLFKSNVLRVNSDRTELVYISSQFANRIATPFQKPRAVDTDDAQIKVEGQSLYVLSKNPDRPIALFITGNRAADPVISLTLIPRNIPPQTIVLQLDTPPVAETPEAAEASDYLSRIRDWMRSVAQGNSPAGFSEAPLPRAVARMGDLIVIPEKRYSGPHFDIFAYRVESTAEVPIELHESSFNGDGVRAIAIHRKTRLLRGESTVVFVLADKSATSNPGLQ